MKLYGLIGKKLGHSFSKRYFTEKFENEGLSDHYYDLFELSEINQLSKLLENKPSLRGLNVTIPYKQEVLPYLNWLAPEAEAVQAVNTIKISRGSFKGFNTDILGFEKSLFENVSLNKINGALILGTGGASKAVAFILSKYNIDYSLVSRTHNSSTITYEYLHNNPAIFNNRNLVVNTTPLGMHPNISSKPEIPYSQISKNHILFDLVYNPEKTSFLEEGASRGAVIVNGLDMLHYQAESAWQIWNDNTL